MTITTERPEWAQGWDHLEQPPASPAPTTGQRRRDPKIYVIIALAVALAATLGLSIVAATDMESTIAAQAADLDSATDSIIKAETDRDLAEELAGQEAWRADQCHIAADAATSLSMAGYAALDGDMAAFDEWMADTQRALSGSGYSNVLEAWNACNDLV